jgi:hypothetical protein
MASRNIDRLDEKMAGLEPGSLRYQTLNAAKQFKLSWIELGQMLWTVYKQKKFREWGYLEFGAYCAKEVGIREATAKKLLHSYYFLEKEEPTVLRQLREESTPEKVPSPDSVNLLRLLKSKPEVNAQNYQKVRGYVLDKGKEAPEIRKEVKTILQEARADDEDPDEAREQRARMTVRRMVGTLKSIRQQLTTGDLVSEKLLKEIDALSQKLEEVLS